MARKTGAALSGERDKTLSRKEQAENTKAALREAGIELIETRSYDEITIEDITSMCNVSKGTFYLYFKSKDDFFFSMCAHDFHEAVAYLKDPSITSSIEQLRLFITEWLKMQKATSIYFTRHWFVTLLTTKYNEDTGFASAPIDPGQQYKKPLRDCLKRGIKNGELSEDTPVEDIIELIIMSVYGTSLRDVMRNRKFNLNKWTKSLCAFILDGALAPYRLK